MFHFKSTSARVIIRLIFGIYVVSCITDSPGKKGDVDAPNAKVCETEREGAQSYQTCCKNKMCILRTGPDLKSYLIQPCKTSPKTLVCRALATVKSDD